MHLFVDSAVVYGLEFVLSQFKLELMEGHPCSDCKEHREGEPVLVWSVLVAVFEELLVEGEPVGAEAVVEEGGHPGGGRVGLGQAGDCVVQ